MKKKQKAKKIRWIVIITMAIGLLLMVIIPPHIGRMEWIRKTTLLKIPDDMIITQYHPIYIPYLAGHDDLFYPLTVVLEGGEEAYHQLVEALESGVSYIPIADPVSVCENIGQQAGGFAVGEGAKEIRAYYSFMCTIPKGEIVLALDEQNKCRLYINTVNVGDAVNPLSLLAVVAKPVE